MKAILYVVAILAIGGSAYFTLEHSRKFDNLQKDRLETIAKNKAVSANADVKEKELKDEQAILDASKQKHEELTQSISALKSTGAALSRDAAELDATLAEQAEEFTELEKALQEVNVILADLGGDVTIDNLGSKIQEIDEDKQAKEAKLEELETLIQGAEKVLAGNRSQVDRLVTRTNERNTRISRNAMESVVTAVNQEWGFLVIGAGSNSGFTPQTSLIVKRDGRMIGRVRPSSIEPTQTIAEIDYDSLAPGVRIQPGDQVLLAQPNTN